MINKLLKNLRDENGQGVMEYLIITSLIGIFCLGVIKGFGSNMQKRIKEMKSEIATEINI